MKAMNRLALVGAAAIAAIGLASAAGAGIKHSHVLEIRLPDGSLEQIRYAGDTPPVVRLQPDWTQVAALPADDLFGAQFPFAALERISALMDREAAAWLQQAPGLPALAFDGPGLTQVDLGKLPPGMSGYSVVSTMSGGRVCTRETRYGPVDGSGAPKAVTRVSGDCGGAATPSASADRAASAPDAAPRLQTVSARY